MRNTFATIFAGSVLAALVTFQAQAMPLAPSQLGAGAGVILVEDHCGPGFHRGEFGRCRPNERERVIVEPGVVVVEPHRACPPGMHLGPEGRECHLNR